MHPMLNNLVEIKQNDKIKYQSLPTSINFFLEKMTVVFNDVTMMLFKLICRKAIPYLMYNMYITTHLSEME